MRENKGCVHTWCPSTVPEHGARERFLMGTNVSTPFFQVPTPELGHGGRARAQGLDLVLWHCAGYQHNGYPESEHSTILCRCLGTSARVPSVNTAKGFFSHLHSIRLMWSTAFDPGLRPLSTLILFQTKRSCFAPFSRRFASTLIVFVSFSPVHTATIIKRETTWNRLFAILDNHGRVGWRPVVSIWMTSPFSDSIVFTVHTSKQRFQKASFSNCSTLESVFEWLRFRWSFSAL